MGTGLRRAAPPPALVALGWIAMLVVGLPALLAGATPTPTPPPTPIPSATPTPTLTPTPDWALKILDVPTVLAMEPDGTALSATHNALIPDGTAEAALGFWSREIQPNTGPWRFHGLAGFGPPPSPGTDVVTTTTWPEPDDGVVYELSARYRFDGAWDGAFFYFHWIDPAGSTPTPTPTPGPDPELHEVFLLDDPAGAEITAISNGSVSYPASAYNMGFWYRQRQPPTPWTYMGTFPYSNGQTEVSQPLPLTIEDGVLYEVAARIRTADGWATPFLTSTYQRPVEEFTATYQAFLKAGPTNGFRPIGATGTGIDNVPASRLGLLFMGGSGGGPDGSSPVMATFTEGLSTLSGLPPGPIAPVSWHLTFDRTDWTGAGVKLHLTPADLIDIETDRAALYVAPAPGGPWELANLSGPGVWPGVVGGFVGEVAPNPDSGLVELHIIVGESDPVEVAE